MIDLINKYQRCAKEYALQCGIDSDHLAQIIASIMMTRDNVLTGGSFVRAVCDNDLVSAVSRADLECLQHIRFLVSALQYAKIS